jgi:hypothetical protein
MQKLGDKLRLKGGRCKAWSIEDVNPEGAFDVKA